MYSLNRINLHLQKQSQSVVTISQERKPNKGAHIINAVAINDKGTVTRYSSRLNKWGENLESFTRHHFVSSETRMKNRGIVAFSNKWNGWNIHRPSKTTIANNVYYLQQVLESDDKEAITYKAMLCWGRLPEDKKTTPDKWLLSATNDKGTPTVTKEQYLDALTGIDEATFALYMLNQALKHPKGYVFFNHMVDDSGVDNVKKYIRDEKAIVSTYKMETINHQKEQIKNAVTARFEQLHKLFLLEYNTVYLPLVTDFVPFEIED